MNDIHAQPPEQPPKYLFNDGPPASDDELFLPPSLHHANYTEPPKSRVGFFFFLAMASGAALFAGGWLIGTYMEDKQETASVYGFNPDEAPALATTESQPATEEITTLPVMFPVMFPVTLPATLPTTQPPQTTSRAAASLGAASVAADPVEATKRPVTLEEAAKSPLPSAPAVIKEKSRILWRSISFAPCKIVGEGIVTVEVVVASDGTITQATGDSPLGRCVAKRLEGKPGFSAGSEGQQTITVKVR